MADLADLFVLPDNQPPGDAEKLLTAVAARLAALGWQGRLWRVAVPDPFKDVSEWRAHDPTRFKAELTAAFNDRRRVELAAANKRHERNGHAAPEPAALFARTTCAADVKPKPLRWLVPEMLPLVLLAGDGGLGKSVLTIDLAARLSRGERAFGLEYEAIAGETLLVSCEDDPADTIVPRLLAAGADLGRVHFLEGVGTEDGRPSPWSLAHHAALANYLAEHPTRLVVIDPANAFAGLAGIDGHKDAELRALLGPLAEVAARHSVTILLVAHLGKNETVRAVRRVLGSVAWVNAVRAAWIVAEREEDGGKRLLLPIKANLAPRRRGLTYQLMPLTEMEQDLALAGIDGLGAEDFDRLKRQLFRVVWLGETDAEADRVFAAAARRPELPTDADKAKNWLQEHLSEGPLPSTACVDEGNAVLGLDKGLKWWRENILKDKLAGKPLLRGFGAEGVWYFTLRSHDWPPSESPAPEKAASLDSLAESRENDASEPRKIHREARESQSAPAWIAADADPAALHTPLDPDPMENRHE